MASEEAVVRNLDKKICMKCGATNPPSAKRCKKCGSTQLRKKHKDAKGR